MGGRALIPKLVEVVALPELAQVHHPELQRPVADRPCVMQVVPDVALILVVGPEDLILPVLRIEAVGVVEEVDFPFFRRRTRFGTRSLGFRTDARCGHA